MDVKFRNTQNFIKTKRITHKELSIPKLSRNFNNKEQRPFDSNSQNLSFKGLFYKPVVEKIGDKLVPKIFDAQHILKITNKHLGPNFENLYKDLKKNPLAKKMFSEVNGKVIFHKKSFLKLLTDGMIYPIKILPADMLNGTVGLLKKVKPLQKWAERVYESPTFKTIRQRSKIDSKVNSLRGLFETVEKIKGKTEEEISSTLFQRSGKMFDEKTGNYDTKHERALNRLVSGIIPAVFLANDAYNLSRLCNDNPKEAKKEKKIRFKQELSRIGFSSYLMLITYGALQKYINKSKAGIMLMTATTVLFTEAISRLSNGKFITRLSPEKAKEINEKEHGKKQKFNILNFQIKHKIFENFNKEQDVKVSNNIQPQANNKEKQKEPLLSPPTLLKACAIAISAGFAVKGLRLINLKNFKKEIIDVNNQKRIVKNVGDFIDNVIFKPFKVGYEKITMEKNHKILREDFDKIIKKLEQKEVGFEALAQKYKEVVSQIDAKASKTGSDFDQKYINLGTKKKKIKPVIDFMIAPFRFAFGAVTLPYRLMDKLLKVISTPITDSKTIKKIIKLNDSPKEAGELKGIVKNFMKNKEKDKVIEKINKMNISTQEKELAKELIKKMTAVDLKNEDIKALSQGIDFIKKASAKGDLHFQRYMEDNIAKGFNIDNMSGLSNSDLSNLAKTSATAATLWFLMADNYNMVMLKSNGEDKEGAKLKSKERFVQEMSRLFYQTLLIDLFNSTFRSQYNSSLLGMSWITTANTTIGEFLTRKSVGMPVKPHTKDELIEIDKKKENAKGFLKGYYNFMTRLTGKKSLAEQHQSKQIKKS